LKIYRFICDAWCRERCTAAFSAYWVGSMNGRVAGDLAVMNGSTA
jgi:hypothetical protein